MSPERLEIHRLGSPGFFRSKQLTVCRDAEGNELWRAEGNGLLTRVSIEHPSSGCYDMEMSPLARTVHSRVHKSPLWALNPTSLKNSTKITLKMVLGRMAFC